MTGAKPDDSRGSAQILTLPRTKCGSCGRALIRNDRGNDGAAYCSVICGAVGQPGYVLMMSRGPDPRPADV